MPHKCSTTVKFTLELNKQHSNIITGIVGS